MITKPVVYTPIEDAEVSLERPTNQDLLRKIYQNINMLGELAVIGAVEAFAINQVGVTSPDTTVWQLCDGSEITNTDSPLRSITPTSRYTPDIRDRYIRGANASTNIGNELGGNPTVNLEHGHGITSAVCFPIVGTSGDEQTTTPTCHYHGIQPELNPAEPLEMAHQQVAWYLKIN